MTFEVKLPIVTGIESIMKRSLREIKILAFGIYCGLEIKQIIPFISFTYPAMEFTKSISRNTTKRFPFPFNLVANSKSITYLRLLEAGCPLFKGNATAAISNTYCHDGP